MYATVILRLAVSVGNIKLVQGYCQAFIVIVFFVLYSVNDSIASKLICYTRSSHLITSNDDVLSQVTHDDPSKVSVCKFAQSITQNRFEKLLKEFLKNQQREVFLLVISMYSAHKDMVKILNHVRIIIESEESPSKSKLFVILVHFPPVMFFNACYPTLFLNGWDHFYLDSIVPVSPSEPHANSSISLIDQSSINIQEWSLQFCHLSKQCTNDNLKSLICMLNHLLDLSIPMIVSQILVANRRGTIFNASIDGYERSELVRKLLHEYDIGRVLIDKFSQYWNPKAMNAYIRKAALQSYTQNSRLNLSDSMHYWVRSFFFDFLIYMLSWMNLNCGLEIFFSNNLAESVSRLLIHAFITYLKNVPLPSLSDLDLRKLKNHKMSNDCVYSSVMPFSSDIFGFVEDVTDKCLQEVYMDTTDGERYDSSIEEQACKLAVKDYVKVLGVSNFAEYQNLLYFCCILHVCYTKIVSPKFVL